MTITTTPPPTTRPTVAHDSMRCNYGPAGQSCAMCAWANEAAGVVLGPFKQSAAIVQQSAAATRARRTALLERADANSPTEGAVALAEAYLDAADWWQCLPNNAMQDAAVLELARGIESAIDNYLQRQREE